MEVDWKIASERVKIPFDIGSAVAFEPLFSSRVAWECSPKWVVNSI